MTQPQLRDLVRASNPVVNPDRLLLEDRDVLDLYREAMQRAGNPQVSADLLDLPVERRRDMQTQQRPTELVTKIPNKQPRRWLVAAAAAATVVLAIGLGAFLFNNDAPEVVDPPPTTPAPTTTVAPTTTLPPVLQTGEGFNQAAITADWDAVAALFTDTATLQFVGPDGPSPLIQFTDPLPDGAGIADWSGDGAVTEFDWFLRQGAEIYVGHTTAALACEAVDAATLVCDEVREGFAFKATGHKAVWTLTVANGQVTALVLDLTESTSDGADRAKVGSYRSWVRDNRPEQLEGLFVDFATLDINPDNLEIHRALVAEWQAEQTGS